MGRLAIPDRSRRRDGGSDQATNPGPSGSHVAMTNGKKHNSDIKAKKTRNKKTNAAGEEYDKRDGFWSLIDKAIVLEGEALMDWLTPERVEVELRILNDGKTGRPFAFPPSVILMAQLIKADDDRSYRRCISRLRPVMKLKGIDIPTYSTLHKDEMKFFGSHTRDASGLNWGQRIMREAGEILKEIGIEELLDPVMMVGSGVGPVYEAPQLKVTSEAQQRLQELRDMEAEEIERAMEVMVMTGSLDDGPISGAVDGSGQGIEGPGIYMEHIWLNNQRRFIKQHTFLNIVTMDVVSCSITLEKPGDAKMLVPLVEGAVKMDADVVKVRADSAYDTESNWKAMEILNVEFVPNLKEKFGKNHELPKRNAQLEREQEVGKKEFHIETGYNIRWLVEVFFSVFKRLYGEKIRSRKFERMCLNMQFKYQAYSIHRRFMKKAVEGAYHRMDECLAA